MLNCGLFQSSFCYRPSSARIHRSFALQEKNPARNSATIREKTVSAAQKNQIKSTTIYGAQLRLNPKQFPGDIHKNSFEFEEILINPQQCLMLNCGCIQSSFRYRPSSARFHRSFAIQEKIRREIRLQSEKKQVPHRKNIRENPQ